MASKEMGAFFTLQYRHLIGWQLHRHHHVIKIF